MYIPRRYEEKDREKIFSFIRENGFAILVSVKDGLPIATHIPLLLEKEEGGEEGDGNRREGSGQDGDRERKSGNGLGGNEPGGEGKDGESEEGKYILVGHISIGNEQKHSLQDGSRVLAIFPGPHAYISPRWYTQPNVPTWNYISVHVYGTLKIMEGEELRRALSRLVGFYEGGQAHPLRMEDIPEKTVEDNIRGIIGFSIAIEEIQAAYKLSQNRDEQSFHQVIGQLRQGDEMSAKVAQEMQERSSQIFKKGEEKAGS